LRTDWAAVSKKDIFENTIVLSISEMYEKTLCSYVCAHTCVCVSFRKFCNNANVKSAPAQMKETIGAFF
jgi:hypothetical protein